MPIEPAGTFSAVQRQFPRGLAWVIRALPVVVAAAGAATNGWAGFFTGLVGGWVLAVLLAHLLARTVLRAIRTQDTPEDSLAETPTAPAAPADAPARVGPERAGAPAPTPHPAARIVKARSAGRRVEIIAPDEATTALLADLAAAEEEARRNVDGFLTGDHVLIGDRLESKATSDQDVVWVRCRLDGGRPIDPVREHWDHTWIRPVPRDQVRCEVRYRAHADHTDGGVLELRSVASSGAVATQWHRADNDDVAATIPDGFIWEKNDDYYHGYVDRDSLTNVRDTRVRLLLGG